MILAAFNLARACDVDLHRIKESLSEHDYRLLYSNLGVDIAGRRSDQDGWITGLFVPFGKDKNPSFSVNLMTGKVNDFGSDFYGDIFDLTEAVKGCDTAEAFRWVAQATGRQIPDSRLPKGSGTGRNETSPRRPVSKTKKQRFSRTDSEEWAKVLCTEQAEAIAARVYLKRRGIDLEEMERIGVGLGLRLEGQTCSISFFRQLRDGDLWCKHIAFDPNKESWLLDKNGRKRIYTQGKATLYPGQTLRPSGPAILCEGEVDTLSALSQGFNAVTATAGAGTWTDKFSKMLCSVVDAARGVIVAYDGDESGRAGAEKVSQSLQDQGIVSVILKLPDGTDINDVVVKGELKSMLSVARSDLARSLGDNMKLVQLSELFHPKPVSWTVDKLVPSDYLTIVYGEGGVGKSMLALALSIAVAEGKPFLRRSVAQCPVLYLDAELSADLMKERADKLLNNFSLSDLPKSLFYRSLSGSLDQQTISEIQVEVERNNIGLIVLDSLSIALNARDLKDGSEIIEQLRRISKLGTVICIDHVAKSQNEGVKSSPFGSVFKTNVARSLIRLSKSGQAYKLEQTKCNFSALQDRLYYAVDFAEESIGFKVLGPGDSLYADCQQTGGRTDDCFQIVCSDPGIKADEVGRQMEVSTKTARNHLSALKKEGRTTNKKGAWFPVDETNAQGLPTTG